MPVRRAVRSAIWAVAALSACSTAGQAPRFTATSKADISPWEPGDDVPGWEDADCPVETGADSVVVEQMFATVRWYGLLVDERGVALGPSFDLQDCTEFSCDGAGVQIDVPDVSVTLVDFSRDIWNKQGEYCAGDECYTSGWSASLAIGGYSTGGEHPAPDVTLCLSRVRPDQILGVMTVDYLHQTLPHEYVQRVQVHYPFEVLYGDHCAWDRSVPVGDASPPEECPLTITMFDYQGSATYDTSWDWDAITDPAIREELYTRYTPFNWD